MATVSVLSEEEQQRKAHEEERRDAAGAQQRCETTARGAGAGGLRRSVARDGPPERRWPAQRPIRGLGRS